MAQALVSRCNPVDGKFGLPLLAQLEEHLKPFAGIFPDRRLFRRFAQAIKGVIAASAPIVSRMAAAVLQSRDPKRTFHIARRFYRWLANPRFHHRDLLKPAYALTRSLFQNDTTPCIPVLLDFTSEEAFRFLQEDGLRCVGEGMPESPGLHRHSGRSEAGGHIESPASSPGCPLRCG